jgi:hypothetical protein
LQPSTALGELEVILSSLNLSDTATRDLKAKIEAYSLANRFVAPGSPVEQSEVAAVVGTLQAGESSAPSAPTGKRGVGKRGAGGYNRVDERKAFRKETDKPKKLALFLEIVNHSENPSDTSEWTESWRGWYPNALLVKRCHDVCHGGVGTAFLAKYASGSKKFKLTKWICSCDEAPVVER